MFSKKIFFLLIVFIAATSCNKNTAYQIPESVISAIVKKSFIEQAASPTHAEIETRTAEVTSFLESKKMQSWYSSYQKEFGFPITGPEYVADRSSVTDPKLGYYYIRPHLTTGENLINHQCVSDGVDPSPTMSGFCGLANWNAFLLTGKVMYRSAFIKWADFFLKNHNDGRLYWDFDLPSRNLKSPWISGLSQSLGVSLLLRAYQATGDGAYLDAASKVFKWLKLPIEEGGVSIRTGEGVWFEEYPDSKQSSHVLNGHIWALFGIWDYFRVTDDPEAKKMFWDGIQIIKADIDNYDVGFWVVYAQTNRVDYIKGNYMAFIIQQLNILYAITGDPFFDAYSGKWERYQKTDALFVHLASEKFLNSHMSPK